MVHHPAHETDIDHTLKILILGDSGVGKTSLLTRFIDKCYDGRSCATIGVDFSSKVVSHDDVKVKLSIWDTAGQERFRTLTSTFYRRAKGVIFVYDVTRRESLQNLEDVWLQELSEFGTEQEAIKMVVANKVDVGVQRQVSSEEGSAFAERHGCLFHEVSAKANISVEVAFDELVQQIMGCPSLLGPPARISSPGGDTVKLFDKDHRKALPAPARSGYCC